MKQKTIKTYLRGPANRKENKKMKTKNGEALAGYLTWLEHDSNIPRV